MRIEHLVVDKVIKSKGIGQYKVLRCYHMYFPDFIQIEQIVQVESHGDQTGVFQLQRRLIVFKTRVFQEFQDNVDK